ncbi:MAG: HAD domain-containing protein [Candidatus Spechtbacterales bacterium]|nr:HAD domain-containing protein [Candidatus Spechtbacterales bacterium]
MKSVKVLFLDIDGVLRRFNAEDAPVGMEPGPVWRLREVVEDCNLKIVISSDWRLRKDWRERVLKFMGICGWDNPPIIDCTPNFGIWDPNSNFCRGDEVQFWLDTHTEVKSFAILDDDNEDPIRFLPSQEDRFILVDFKKALTSDNANALRSLF